MAEVLGVVSGVAGIVSLCMQLTECAVKLRRLQKNWKGAPQDLEEIAIDIELYTLLLRDLERDFERDRRHYGEINAEITARCIWMWKVSCRAIEDAVDRLERAIQRSKYLGRLKFVSEGREIENLYVKLGRAMNSLTLAHQLYTESHRQADTRLFTALIGTGPTQDGAPGDYRRRLHAPTQQIDNRPNEPENVVESVSHRSRRSKRAASYQARFYLAKRSSLLPYIYSFSMSTTQSGLVFNIRISNVVPSSSEIFQLCTDGDIRGVRELFQKRKASPFDCALQGGLTVLGVSSENVSQATGWFDNIKADLIKTAASSGNIELCKYILSEAGYPALVYSWADPLSDYIWGAVRRGSFARDQGLSVEMFRLMTSQAEMDVEYVEKDGYPPTWWMVCPNSACLRILQNTVPYSYQDIAWTKRLQNAMHLFIYDLGSTVEMLLQAAGCDATSIQLATTETPTGNTIVHTVARATTLKNFPATSRSWSKLLSELIISGCDLHKQDCTGRTPMMFALESASVVDLACETERLRTWAKLLSEAGVNLSSFGMKEEKVWKNEPSMPWAAPQFRRVDRKVVGFTFGPTFEDWTSLVRKVCIIPLYRPSAPPGAWPRPQSIIPDVLIWEPDEEDALIMPWQWKLDREVSLVSPSYVAGEQEGEFNDTYNGVFHGTQDDCSILALMMTRKANTAGRPRSCSQNRLENGRSSCGVVSARPWFPEYHLCCFDGERRLGSSERRVKYPFWQWQTVARRCAKGQHDEEVSWAGIDRQMRTFRKRFSSKEELQRLPYAVYHNELSNLDSAGSRRRAGCKPPRGSR